MARPVQRSRCIVYAISGPDDFSGFRLTFALVVVFPTRNERYNSFIVGVRKPVSHETRTVLSSRTRRDSPTRGSKKVRWEAGLLWPTLESVHRSIRAPASKVARGDRSNRPWNTAPSPRCRG